MRLVKDQKHKEPKKISFSSLQSPIAIALTAYAGEINQQQALETGFQLHLAKPADPEELMQAVAHLVQPPQLS
jgi:CheY-like chemotaxis protein